MKKILFFIPTLGEGGAERVLVNLVNNLDTSKYEITVFTLFNDGIYRNELKKNIFYKYYFKRSFRGNIHFFKILNPRLLFKIMISDKYDIIISYLEGPTTRIISGNTSQYTKIVNWVHTEIYDRKVITRSYRSFAEALKSYSVYDATIFVSKTVKDSFEELFGRHPNKHYVLYNTINTEDILKKSEETIDDIIFSDEKINLISVGTFKEKKGFMRLLTIVHKLVSEGENIHLYLLGKGEQEDKYKEYIGKNNLDEHVTIIGFRSNPYKYVKKSTLFVCSSYSEGYSTAVTESLILGTPVITTLCSGMEELLGDSNQFGIIVDNNEDALYDGLKKILNNNDLLKYYKVKALERSEHFSTKKTVMEVEKMLDNL